MRIFDLFRRRGARDVSIPHAPASSVIGGGLASLMGRRSGYSRSRQLDEALRLDVAIAVNAVAERVAKHYIRVYRCELRGGRVIRTPDDTHPLSQLLWRPNPHWDWSKLAFDIAINRRLTGEAFLYTELNALGEIVELWPLRPDHMTEVRSSTTYLEGWIYKPGWVQGRGVFLPADRVVHIMRPSRHNPLRGASVIEQQAERIDTGAAIAAYGRSIVESGGRVDLHLRVDSDDPAEVRGARELIVGAFERARRERIITTGASTTLTPLNLKPSDLEFIELARMTRDSILVALGAPPEVVGFTHSSNRATMDAAYRSWNRDVIDPELTLIAAAIEHKLLPRFPGGEAQEQAGARVWYEVGYDNPIPEDEELEARISRELVEGAIITPNEARLRIGLDPIEGGDDLLVSMGRAPLSMIVSEIKASIQDTTEDKYNERGIRSRAQSGTDPRARADLSNAEYGDWWIRSRHTPAERRFARVHRAMAAEQMREVLANLEAQKEEIERQFVGRYPEANQRRLERDSSIVADILFDFERWVERFGSASLPLIQSMVRRAADDISLEIGFAKIPLSPEIKSWVRSRAYQHYAEEVNRTTLERLREELLEGLTQGEPYTKHVQRIRKIYSDLSRRRAVMAARTETTAALNFGANQAISRATEEGIKLGKKWLAVRDGRERPSHHAAHGQMADKDGRFTVGGHSCEYPGDPSLPAREVINCRCTIRSVRLDPDN